MALGGGIRAGSVFVELFGKVDRSGFEQFEREHLKAQKLKDIETRLGGDFDRRDFKLYEEQLDRVQKRVAHRDAFKAALGGDYNATAFRAYERDLSRAERETVTSSGKMRTAFGTVWGRGGALFAAAGGAYGLVAAVKSVTGAYGEAQVSQQKLETQLKALGISYTQHARQIDTVIQKTSQLSGLDDEDLADSFTNIVRVTGNVTQSLHLTGLAADFARAKHLDVAKAGEIVAKVAGGNTGILSRYGIVLQKGATSAQALGELQRRFAGQAEAYGKTQQGAMDRVSVASENLREALGRRLAPAITRVSNAFADLLNGNVSIRKALGLTEEDVRSLRRAFQNMVNAVDAVTSRLLPIIRAVFGGMRDYIRGQLKVISGILTLNFGKAWDGVVDQFRGGVRSAVGVLRGFTSVFRDVGTALVKAVISGIKDAAGGIGDAISGLIPGPLKGLIKKIPGIGDGIGQMIGSNLSALFPSAPGGGGLMGAQPALSPIVGVASRFGLQTSSGRRPGAVTSTGNLSYHATGEAVDEAGSPGAMMSFFRYMKRSWGPRLAELIYTPGGAGIRNGRPFTYTGSVAADHYDHVHVALDTGRPGVGDGIGQAADVARRAGFRGRDLLTAVAIAGPESGYHNAARLRTSREDSRGMWQINVLAHPWAAAMNLRDPLANARAAFRVFREAHGFSPWSAFESGRYRGFLGAAARAIGGGSSSSRASVAPTGPVSMSKQPTTGAAKFSAGGVNFLTDAMWDYITAQRAIAANTPGTADDDHWLDVAKRYVFASAVAAQKRGDWQAVARWQAEWSSLTDTGSTPDTSTPSSDTTDSSTAAPNFDAEAITQQAQARADVLAANLRAANQVIAAFSSSGDIGVGVGSGTALSAVGAGNAPVGAQGTLAGGGGRSFRPGYLPGTPGGGVVGGPTGSVIYQFNMPGHPSVLRAIGDSAVAGIGLQPSVSSSREVLGI